MKTLNEEQRSAINIPQGIVVVTAIPGAGKTTTIAERVVNLVKNHGINPYNILCLTFTNKSSTDMKSRISFALKDICNIDNMWISTFHRLSLYALRKHGHLIGLQKNFSIYDADDQLDFVAKVSRLNGVDLDKSEIKTLVKKSNDFRENMISAEQFKKENDSTTFSIIEQYIKLLLEKNAVDFSGMMYSFWELLSKHKSVQNEFINRFTRVHIDESQDVNGIQFEIIKLLAEHQNLFSVGDPDQNLYEFRSASYKHFAEIDKHFKNVQKVILPKNYRSTPEILSVAQKLIRHNRNSRDVNLIAMSKSGPPVVVKEFMNPEQEAAYVAEIALNLKDRHGYEWSDFAVLYRMNSLSRSVEMAFRNRGIPTRVVGGFSFFDRTEIKNSISYLTFLSNQSDTSAFVKSIKFPKRGIGNETIAKLEKNAEDNKQNILSVSKDVKLSGKARDNLNKFVNAYSKAIKMVGEKATIYETADFLFKSSGYYDAIQELADKGGDDAERMENLTEFMSGIKEYQIRNPEHDLSDYLQSVRLMTDYEKDDDDKNRVSLLTGHSAKGMEFKNVFVVSCEENVMPHYFSKDTVDNIESERKILYVCVTRAIDRLYITMAQTRNFRKSEPSRFLVEMGFCKKQ